MCSLYGQPHKTSADKARFGIFQKVYEPRLCASALALQIQRANFVATPWKRAHMPSTCVKSPVGQGWLMDSDDNMYQMHLYEWGQLPNDI